MHEMKVWSKLKCQKESEFMLRALHELSHPLFNRDRDGFGKFIEFYLRQQIFIAQYLLTLKFHQSKNFISEIVPFDFIYQNQNFEKRDTE